MISGVLSREVLIEFENFSFAARISFASLVKDGHTILSTN